MIDLVTLFSEATSIEGKVEALKNKSLKIPSWGTLIEDYEPLKHLIMTDTQSRQKKVRSDGSVEEPARIAIALEQLLCKRVN